MLHFKWDEDIALAWFDMTDHQKYEIGIDFDESIKNLQPDTNASLEDEN